MPAIVREWDPDTCGCEFDFIFDTDGPTNQLPGFSAVLRTCAGHAALTGVALFDACVGENLRKNGVLGIIQQLKAGFLEEDYVWLFDGTRVLHVAVPLSVADKGTLRSAVDTQFGAGLVVVS